MAWNSFRTDELGGMTAVNTTIEGGGGDTIHAYIARPDGEGPYPGVVFIHHAPGWDEFSREFTRRFAEHGFMAICPNLYERFGHGTPEEVTAMVRAAGGLPDASVIADAEAALNWIKAQPESNGKVGVIGPCSGGRHAVLVASSVEGFDAVVDLWGGGVIQSPDDLNENQPVAPIDLTPQLNAPLLGLFGNEDMRPSPEQVNQHEAVLQEHGKTYLFHRYDGAGHAFMAHDRANYRPDAAIDGWNQIVAWFDQYLATPESELTPDEAAPESDAAPESEGAPEPEAAAP